MEMMREYVVKVTDSFVPDAFQQFENEWSPEQELVRCKDCEHRPTYPKAYGAEINGNWCYWCELHRGWKPDEWFCADGERK